MAEKPKFYGGGYALGTYGDRWRAVRGIGRGGQGVVYQVEDTRGELPRDQATKILKDAFKNAAAMVNIMNDQDKFGELLDVLHKIAPKELPRAALKELLPLEDAVNAKTALQRMGHVESFFLAEGKLPGGWEN